MIKQWAGNESTYLVDKSTFPNERERDLNINDNSLGFLWRAKLTFKRRNIEEKDLLAMLFQEERKGGKKFGQIGNKLQKLNK